VLRPPPLSATPAPVVRPRPQTLYNGMLENNCSEHASRMSAMENSTKSASEMLSALTLAYNR
jgi:F0F1-type ATP synthase gamma subunit